MSNKIPVLPNLQPIIQAGIDPKTGLPVKMDDPDKCTLKNDIKLALRVLDEQNAVNRYKCTNLPNGLDGHLLERILYYKAQGMFFKMSDDKFYFLPYALDGTINVYGRFEGVTPLPFNGTTKDSKDAWITGLTRKPQYEVVEELTEDIFDNGCVLLSDYTKQLGELNIPRSLINDPILGFMSEILPITRTALLANSGVKGMRVNDQDAQAEVKSANRSITRAALNGEFWIPITSQIDMQELTEGNPLKASEYLSVLQATDNFRLSLYGLSNGGLFQKKSHMLESEQQMNEGNVGLIYQDGLSIRQHFCDIVNSIWGLGIWCEASETVVGVDQNMDAEISDSEGQTEIVQENEEGGEEVNE